MDDRLWRHEGPVRHRPCMDVLLLETDVDRGHDVAGHLAVAGHRVWRCHDHGAPAFPCRALTTGTCPVEDPGVDVAVTVRRPYAVDPTPTEDGVSCALRARIPVVVATAGENPFGEYAAAVIADADVVDECERLLAAPSPRHSAVASEALGRALARHAPPTASGPPSAATVYRSAAGLRVELDGLAHLDGRTRGMVVTRVVAALRAFDQAAPTIDVATGETAADART